MSVSRAAGTATLSVDVPGPGRQWRCKSLSLAGGGTPVLAFDFATQPTVASAAPVVVTGTATFTRTPAVTIALGAAVPKGWYAQMEWGGMGGAPPATATLKGAMTGTVPLVVDGNVLKAQIGRLGIVIMVR